MYWPQQWRWWWWWSVTNHCRDDWLHSFPLSFFWSNLIFSLRFFFLFHFVSFQSGQQKHSFLYFSDLTVLSLLYYWFGDYLEWSSSLVEAMAGWFFFLSRLRFRIFFSSSSASSSLSLENCCLKSKRDLKISSSPPP